MHETLSKNFIGNIDSIKREGRNYCIEGWVVPLLESNSCVVGCQGFVSIVSIERQDIYSEYKQQHLNYLRSGFRLLVLPEKETLIIKVNEDDVFKINVDLTEYLMTPGLFSSKETIIVDNFYQDPQGIRNYALSLDYSRTDTRFAGLRSIKSYVPSWMSEKLSKYVGEKFKEYNPYAGIFQLCSSSDLISYNYLDTDYIGLIALTPNISEDVGISTFKSKITGLTHKAKNFNAHEKNTTIEKLNTESFNGDNFDNTNLIEIDKIMLKYNRLVILKGESFHALTKTCGNRKENFLLFHYFSFNVCSEH